VPMTCRYRTSISNPLGRRLPVGVPGGMRGVGEVYGTGFPSMGQIVFDGEAAVYWQPARGDWQGVTPTANAVGGMARLSVYGEAKSINRALAK
jgi:hypothetical protein